MNPTKPNALGSIRRKVVNVSSTQLIETKLLHPHQALPLVVQPTHDRLELANWASAHRLWIETQLQQYGGLLFRGFEVSGTSGFEQFMQAIGGELLTYAYQSTPRTQVAGNVYTSTEYPASQFIPLHNEMAYAHHFPLKIGFFCVQPAETGGATPIADSRRVLQQIPTAIRDRFRQLQILYVRNYSDRWDLPWQQVFQTNDKEQVEAYCQSTRMTWEWYKTNQLRTQQVCPAIATHPHTKESIWFNQAHLFHISNLPPEIRDGLFAEFTDQDLPRNAFYGDGTPIENSVFAAVRTAYQRETIEFPWQAGDVLLLDNLLVAHGRTPFTGNRKVLVGMVEAWNWDKLVQD
jgi:alpha-ketoglutarate-dependent taurine dioxygenase